MRWGWGEVGLGGEGGERVKWWWVDTKVAHSLQVLVVSNHSMPWDSWRCSEMLRDAQRCL